MAFFLNKRKDNRDKIIVTLSPYKPSVNSSKILIINSYKTIAQMINYKIIAICSRNRRACFIKMIKILTNNAMTNSVKYKDLRA